MADTTEAVERLTYEEAEKLALRAIHDVDGRGMIGRGRDHLHQRVARAILTSEVKRTALLSERTALLERVERAEAGNLHPLAEKVWHQSCQGWMDRAQAAETKLATLTEAVNKVWTIKHIYESQLSEFDCELDAEDAQVIASLFDDIRAALSQTQEEKTNG